MKRLLPLLLLSILLLGACRGGSDENTTTTVAPSTTSQSSTVAPSTTSPASSTAPGPTTSAPAGATTQPTTCAPVTGGGDSYSLLKAVRVGTHDGYDRITFEFVNPTGASLPVPVQSGVVPKYELTRVPKIIADGSGDTVVVAGSDLHQVVFHGATGFDQFSNPPAASYTGAKEFKPNFPVLAELQQSGDFEATLSWGFGLKQLRCPTVTELKSPTRLVIDIPH